MRKPSVPKPKDDPPAPGPKSLTDIAEEISGENLRDRREIEQASALLHASALGLLPGIAPNPILQQTLQWVDQSLCWVLRHTHGSEFMDYLAACEKSARQNNLNLTPQLEQAQVRADAQARVGRLPGDLAVQLAAGRLTLDQAERAVRLAAADAVKGHGPLGDGYCDDCGHAHHPRLPHNPLSERYRARFALWAGYYPDWSDAVAHCPEAVQRAVMTALGPAWPVAAELPADVLARLAAALQPYS